LSEARDSFPGLAFSFTLASSDLLWSFAEPSVVRLLAPLDENLYEIATVLDHWYEPSAMYFKVESRKTRRTCSHYDQQAAE
jgi:hypothetical protein